MDAPRTATPTSAARERPLHRPGRSHGEGYERRAGAVEPVVPLRRRAARTPEALDAAEDRRRVGRHVDEAVRRGRREVCHPEPHPDPDRSGEQQHGGHEHHRRRPLVHLVGLGARVLVRGVLVLRLDVAPAEERAGARAQDGSAAEARGEHHQRGNETVAGLERSVLDHRLAEKGAERGQRCDEQGARAEQRTCRGQVACLSVQAALPDLPDPHLDDAHAREQQRLAETVSEHVYRRSGDPVLGEQAEARQEDPDEGDRDEREHALQVILVQRHHGAPQRGEDAEADENPADHGDLPVERRLEGAEPDPPEAVEADLAHRAGQHDADGRERHGVGVIEPEVERDDGGLHEQCAGEQHEGDDHHAVVARVRERPADLGQVERAGLRVDEADSQQEQERPDHVDHGEVQRSLERGLLPDLVADERHR
jgi:hypothetical protein